MEYICQLEDQARIVRAAMRKNFEAMRTFGEILGTSEEGPGTPWIDEKLTELYDTKRSLRSQLQQIESQLRALEGFTTPTRDRGGCVVGIPVTGDTKVKVNVNANVKRELVWGN